MPLEGGASDDSESSLRGYGLCRDAAPYTHGDNMAWARETETVYFDMDVDSTRTLRSWSRSPMRTVSLEPREAGGSHGWRASLRAHFAEVFWDRRGKPFDIETPFFMSLLAVKSDAYLDFLFFPVFFLFFPGSLR